MLKIQGNIMLEKSCSTSLDYSRPTYICFNENGYTDVNTSCKPNEKLNIPGTITPIALIFAIATKETNMQRRPWSF